MNKLLIAAMAAKGINAKVLAELSGLSASSISNLKHGGAASATADTINRVCRAMRMTPDLLGLAPATDEADPADASRESTDGEDESWRAEFFCERTGEWLRPYPRGTLYDAVSYAVSFERPDGSRVINDKCGTVIPFSVGAKGAAGANDLLPELS